MPVTRRAKASSLRAATKSSTAKVVADVQASVEKLTKSAGAPLQTAGISTATTSTIEGAAVADKSPTVSPTTAFASKLHSFKADTRGNLTLNASSTVDALVAGNDAGAADDSTATVSSNLPTDTKSSAGNNPSAGVTVNAAYTAARNISDGSVSGWAELNGSTPTSAVKALSSAVAADSTQEVEAKGPADAKSPSPVSFKGATAPSTAVVHVSSTAANASAAASLIANANATVLAASNPLSTAASADAQARDALAAEALDATDGPFSSVADAIEAANFGCGVGPAVNSFDEGGVPGRGYGSGTVTPSGFDSNATATPPVDPSVKCQTVRKPGFQTALKAPLDMHMQATAKCSTVTPSGVESNTSSTVDSTVRCAGSAGLGGGQCVQAPASATAPT